MNGLEERRAIARAPRRNHADGAGQRRGFIAKDIAEEIRRQQDVELVRAQNDLHRRVVHVKVLDREIARCRGQSCHRSPPQPGGGQHVGLIDGRYPMGPNPRARERKLCDALDFRHAIAGQVRCAFFLALTLGYMLAKIDIADEFADDLEIDLRIGIQPQRAERPQRLAKLDRAHVGIHAQRLPQHEQAGLRPAVQRLRIPLRAADGSQQHRIGLQAAFQCLLGQGFAAFVDGHAAEGKFN